MEKGEIYAIIVVGLNNEALEDALYLSSFAKKITIINNGEKAEIKDDKDEERKFVKMKIFRVSLPFLG